MPACLPKVFFLLLVKLLYLALLLGKELGDLCCLCPFGSAGRLCDAAKTDWLAVRVVPGSQLSQSMVCKKAVDARDAPACRFAQTSKRRPQGPYSTGKVLALTLSQGRHTIRNFDLQLTSVRSCLSRS